MTAAAEGLRVVVLTHGSGTPVAGLLDSLRDEGVAAEQIVVVHNPSRRGEQPPELPPGCELIAAPYNLGYAIGMNRGIDHQLRRGAELVLVATHDARFRPGGLERLLRAAREQPEYGVLGPALLLSGTDVSFSFGGVTGIRGRGHLHERPATAAEVNPCDWIDGGTMLFRAELLERIGGFEERYWIYCEDSEICLRATRAGARVGVVLDAQADQEPGGAKRRAAWAYLMARNGSDYALKAEGPAAMLWMLGSSLLGAALDFGRAGARAIKLRKGPPIEPWSLAVGSLRGVLAFLTRRWGPPPPLPGSGDIENTRP